MTTVAAASSGKKPLSQSSARNAAAKSDLRLPLPLDTPPMEARSSEQLPESDGPWQYEPKWDGFRCLAFKSGDMVELRAKSGKPLGRYFPEVIALLREVAAPQFVVDGELVIELDGRLAFDALQMRLHPAESRIRKLAAATPARLLLFDMLVAPGGTVLIDKPLRQRLKAAVEHDGYQDRIRPCRRASWRPSPARGPTYVRSVSSRFVCSRESIAARSSPSHASRTLRCSWNRSRLNDGPRLHSAETQKRRSTCMVSRARSHATRG
jgi:ATP-dependent DNA ligase